VRIREKYGSSGSASGGSNARWRSRKSVSGRERRLSGSGLPSALDRTGLPPRGKEFGPSAVVRPRGSPYHTGGPRLVRSHGCTSLDRPARFPPRRTVQLSGPTPAPLRASGRVALAGNRQGHPAQRKFGSIEFGVPDRSRLISCDEISPAERGATVRSATQVGPTRRRSRLWAWIPRHAGPLPGLTNAAVERTVAGGHDELRPCFRPVPVSRRSPSRVLSCVPVPRPWAGNHRGWPGLRLPQQRLWRLENRSANILRKNTPSSYSKHIILVLS
jgi:hypothetical protein